MHTNDTLDEPMRSLAETLPPLDLRHLIALTDDTGILQHARYNVADRDHGYCVDDNARALIVACRGHREPGCEELERLAATYLAFVFHAFNEKTGRFRNFMSYDRRWLEESGSEDAHGRALWGIGVAASRAPLEGQRRLSSSLFERAFGASEQFTSPRAWAYALLGADAYLGGQALKSSVMRTVTVLADRLHAQYSNVADGSWHWCEDYLTYDNAVLPWSLLAASHRLHDVRMQRAALGMLEWLLKIQTTTDGHLSPVGNDGWMQRNGVRARFDQQPLDAASLALACADAYRYTGDIRWANGLTRSMGWFTGANDSGAALYDSVSGGCFDGLQESGVNANCGAESTVTWLLARLGADALLRESPVALRDAGFDGMSAPA